MIDVGTSGVGVFDDDGGADWVLELEKGGLGVVEETLGVALALDPVWSDVAVLGLAAADVVARLHSGVDPVVDSNAGPWIWVEDNAGLDVEFLVERALAVVELVLAPNSGLRDLWADTEFVSEWESVVTDIGRRLRLPYGGAGPG